MFKSILGTLVSFIVLDTLWIRLVAVSWYQKAVPHMLLMKDGNVTANIFPAILFSLTLFALNFLGDGLRDILDPRDTQKLEN